MFKLYILLSLAIACVAAQEGPASGQAAPEPYSYGYQTESHAASEQRDPSGKVTGFYTIADADGRERRVEYYADESGFHAKVNTNEVGTKSESPADVEVQASAPTPGQFVYQSQPPQANSGSVARQQFMQQQRVSTARQPGYSQAQYVQQPAGYGYGYGYYPGSGYGNAAYGSGYSATYGTGYGSGYGPGYGTGYGSGYGSGYGTGYGTGYAYKPGYAYTSTVGNYNNHMPSQYYRSISTTTTNGAVPSSYSAGGQNVRYFSQPGVSTTGVRTVGYPGAVSYGVPAGAGTSGTSGTSSSNYQGSSNYLVIQKRAAIANGSAVEEEKSS